MTKYQVCVNESSRTCRRGDLIKFQFAWDHNDHAIIMEVNSTLGSYMTIPSGVMGASPTRQMKTLVVTVEEENLETEPVLPEDKEDLDAMADYIIDKDFYDEYVKGLEKHTCTPHEILYLVKRFGSVEKMKNQWLIMDDLKGRAIDRESETEQKLLLLSE